MALAGQNLIDLLKNQLDVKQGEVDSLLDVTLAINSNYAENELFTLYKQILEYQIGIDRMALYTEANNWSLKDSYGVEESDLGEDLARNMMTYENVTPLDDENLYPGFDLLIPVFHKEHPLAYVMISRPAMESYELLDDKVKFIQTITNIIIVALENKKLFKNQLEQEALKKELTLAKTVQGMLIPNVMFQNEHIAMAALYLPHQDIGGDYYDYMQLNEDEVVYCIADVSGKGISAALLMANFQATLRTLLTQELKPVPFIKQLNERLFETTQGDKFITLFIAKYTFSTRRLRYVNAGHNPSLIVFPDGTHRFLGTGCTVLGIFEELPQVDVEEFEVDPGTVIINFTDGLTDLTNDNNEPLEVIELIKRIKEIQKYNMDELNQELLKEIEKFKGGSDFVDDISVLTCKVF